MKTNTSLILNGFRDVIESINRDTDFSSLKISISKDVEHVIDRINDRQYDAVYVMKKLKSAFMNNKCLMIFYAHLDDRPIRVEFKAKDFTIGLTMYEFEDHRKMFKIRTVVPSTRPSRVSTFVVDI